MLSSLAAAATCAVLLAPPTTAAAPNVSSPAVPASAPASPAPASSTTEAGVPTSAHGPAPARWAHGPQPDVPGTGGPQPNAPAPGSRPGVAESYNWSGLIDQGTTFTGVSASWNVPSVVPSGPAQYSATWIGIDGVSNSSLIQTGTLQATSGGTTDYFAWWEILPAAATNVFPVAPGDQINASIIESPPGTWTITIDDVTSGQVFPSSPRTFSYSGPATSAEWIEEAPTILTGSGPQQSTLANFGQAVFTHLGVSGTNTSGTSVFPVDMVNSEGNVIAYAGPYNPATNSFTDYYGAPQPTITSVSPALWTTAGGVAVTISGTNLGGATSVQFGTTSATFTPNADGTLRAVAPAASAGTVDVRVTTSGGTSALTSADQFTYVTPPTPLTVLPAGSSLSIVDHLVSPNGHYQTIVQTDGNVVTYGPGGVVWSTGTYRTPANQLALQSDGNLVLYGPNGVPYWYTGTSGSGATELVQQDDGNLVLYGPSGPVWSSLYGYANTTLYAGQSLGTNGTLRSANGAFRAILQADGNVVVYGPSGANWSTGTWGTSAAELVLQSDGNLVLYGPHGAVWSSGTWGRGATELVMQNDGNLVLYGPSGAVWSSLYG
jgi:hypothetical protein